MTFPITAAAAALYGRSLGPGDLRNPAEILSTSGTDAFQEASRANQQSLAALATTGLAGQVRLVEQDKMLDYNREADALIAGRDKRKGLFDVVTSIGVGGGATRKAGILDRMGISLPGMNPVEIANQVSAWNQYFSGQENLLGQRTEASAAATNAGTLAAIRNLQAR